MRGKMSENDLRLSALPKTWLVDIDGTILKHNGYKIDGFDSLLSGVSEFFKHLNEQDFVILLTARKQSELKNLKAFLRKNQIRFDKIITDLPFGERILINDTKPSGLKTAFAINKQRDEKLKIKVKIDEKL